MGQWTNERVNVLVSVLRKSNLSILIFLSNFIIKNYIYVSVEVNLVFVYHKIGSCQVFASENEETLTRTFLCVLP